MKKAYENPVAEKIVFDYTNTVVASGPLNMIGTSTEQWCHKKEEKEEEKPVVITPGGMSYKCVKN